MNNRYTDITEIKTKSIDLLFITSYLSLYDFIIPVFRRISLNFFNITLTDVKLNVASSHLMSVPTDSKGSGSTVHWY